MYAHSSSTKTLSYRETSNYWTRVRRQQRKRAHQRRMAEMDKQEMDRQYAARIARIVDEVYQEMINLSPEEWAAWDEMFPRPVDA